MKKRFVKMISDSSDVNEMVLEGDRIEAVMDGDEEEAPTGLEVIYTVNNHLYLYRDITAESAALVNKTLNEMYFDLINAMVSSGLTNPTIEIHLSCNGGDVLSTFAIIKKIKDIQKGFGAVPVPMKVNTHIEGTAASAATLISIIGDHRTMSEYSLTLIHDASGGFTGKRSEIKDYIKTLDLIVKLARKIYKENSTLTDEILDAKDNDIYFDAETCLSYHIIDEIV